MYGIKTLAGISNAVFYLFIMQTPPATVALMHQLEDFGISLASNMVYIKRKEYRGKRSTFSLPSYNKVENNLRKFCVVTTKYLFFK